MISTAISKEIDVSGMVALFNISIQVARDFLRKPVV